ncbi:MAG: hypothetical protein RIC85_00460 [Gammaproteobacteria bacterium]
MNSRRSLAAIATGPLLIVTSVLFVTLALAQATHLPEEHAHVSKRAAYKASKGQVVFHYGEGYQDADILAEIVREDGYPVAVYSGGSPGKLKVYVDAQISFGPFGQEGVVNGIPSNLAKNAFDELVGTQ